jgi:small-conductance mechanosensitive channel
MLWRTSSALLRSNLTKNWSEEASSLVLLVIRIVIIALAALGAAEAMGLSLTPVLASLGIGSLAVALALQDTLANFFAGIYLLIDKPVRIGDYVKVDETTEGVVDRIGWRSTLLRQLNNNTVVIPNNKLLTSQLTNFNLVESECFISLPVGVSYDADLEQVEALLVNIATEVLTAENLLNSEVPPVVRFFNFGESSVDLNVIVQLNDIQQQLRVRHLLIKRIHAAFKAKGIETPYPQRTVHLLKPLDLK